MVEQWGWIALNIVALISIIAAVFYIYRLRQLFSRTGAFEVALRSETDGRWRTGICVFTQDSLNWYATRSLRLRPSVRVSRAGLDLKIEPPQSPDLQIVRLTNRQDTVELGTSPLAVSAIVSWSDSAPPVEEPTLF